MFRHIHWPRKLDELSERHRNRIRCVSTQIQSKVRDPNQVDFVLKLPCNRIITADAIVESPDYDAWEACRNLFLESVQSTSLLKQRYVCANDKIGYITRFAQHSVLVCFEEADSHICITLHFLHIQ